jgi:hypothetical protein
MPVYPGAIQAERLCHVNSLQPTVAQGGKPQTQVWRSL